MNYLKTGLLVGGLLMATACSDDFLDLSPLSEANTGNFYKTAADFDVATIAIYSAFRDYYGGTPYMTYTEYRSDNLTYTLYDYQSVSENAFVDGGAVWNSLYQLIYRSNIVINRIENADIDAGIKSQLKGEALAFRGLGYHHLAVYFGGVPIFTTEPSTKEASTTPRATEAETYKQAEDDLALAVSLLSPENEQGRMNKFIAEGLLARVYITEKKWTDAVAVLADVKDNSNYAFADDFESIWSLQGEKSPEIMLSAVWSDELPTTSFPQQFLNVNNYTQGNFQYENGYYESFEAADKRLDATLGFDPADGKALNNKFDYGEISGNRWTMDIPCLRFTDVLLMYAEALSEASNAVEPESINIVNQIRGRAGLVDLTAADVPDMPSFRARLLNERRSEFAWEGLRWFDLRRTGTAVAALQAAGHTQANEYWLLYQIPQTEIDKMPDVLVQNPRGE
jgi:hypothetical protein